MKKNPNFTAMRIYLLGYMASGKSNLGQLLAERLGYTFLDLDYLFEERFRISVLDFFQKYDENAFRRIEQKLLHEMQAYDDVVISTGGGTPCFYDNMEFIKSTGISIYLHWNVPALVSRLRHIKRKRPLLKDIREHDLEEKVTEHLSEREYYYRQADHTVDTENLDFESLIEWILSTSEKG